MKSFNIKRFGKMLRWVLSVNFHTMLAWTAGAALATFLGEMAMASMSNYYDPITMVHQYALAGVALLLIIATILACMVVSSIHDKRRRGTFLMLPATNAEKFLSLIIYSSVVCMLCTFLALAAGDTLRMVWYWVTGGPREVIEVYDGVRVTYHWHISAIPKLLENITSIRLGYGISGAIYVIFKHFVLYSFFVWVHSLFTLGGTLLRKYSFVATTALLILSMVLFFEVLDKFDLDLFNATWHNGRIEAYHIGAGYVLAVALPLLTIFNYWASYRIFKGFQIITNKWTNYDILKR